MKVLKFGGTSVGSAENIKRVRDIVLGQKDDVIVVISALGGVTDKILNAARVASIGTGYFHSELTAVREKHYEIMDSLFDEGHEIYERINVLLKEMEKILTGVTLVGELTPKTIDRIVSLGERMSSQIIAKYITGAIWKNSADYIRTDSNFVKASVNFKVTNKLIRSEFSGFSGIAVAPGFIAGNDAGEYTTLGRGGSDYTAAIFSAALGVKSLEIWTDVDGFMTADPRVISKAYTIPSLSYSEAMELSHFGAKVIYPPTILPVYQKGIPVLIKNTFNPETTGTIISNKVDNGKDRPIKGISSISGIALMTLQGIGMVGVTGISMRLFTALADEEINVVLISQASSENSISIAIDEHLVDKAESAIRQEFEKEIKTGQINKLAVETELSIVAIVGENMKHTTGVAGKLFNTIGKNGINIIAIAQGASELNISWVVKNTDLRKTLNVVHESFFLSENIELNVYLMGVGTVGGNLLEQLNRQQGKLLKEKHLKIKLAGVADTKKMAFSRDGIDIANYREVLSSSNLTSGLEEFRIKMTEMNMFNSVFVDCTASEEVGGIYKEVLNSNISVVAANKIAASSSYENYSKLKKIAKRKGVKFLFETNVGAGLPIINTLNDLVYSGDKILKIEAVLSGTLNFIFNTISEDIKLSQAIKMAKDMGYSEPDPRIDLSGFDVARKLLILARESGYPLEMSDIKINKFVPEKYFEGSVDDFFASIPEVDADFERRRSELAAQGKKWRFVARFEEGNAETGLQEVESTHPFYDLEGSNNLVMYTTERYHEFPMLIKGYGAGASVTAAGVFADLIKVSNI
ncbi:Aspartokinase / Homoserine dehydrogenase [hydrothermal vent metagenome]|uniref:Aspartokinase / Homoserine dehydrogenase n=1 Tax=hydrothermal vent metagenome TaxID=652676 RepID=A0A3B0UR55_9ZZZZ